ncbi:heterokaryon incompatibility protein-domain-containing protein, partial [Hyaloscypha finlandica]
MRWIRCILFTYTLTVQFASLVYCHVSTAEPTLTGKQVRFVRLFPGRFGDPIHVDFDVQDSSNAISYVALSYSWGSPENTKTIFRKNASVPVGENLYQALQDLRDKYKESLWWIDALSINQTNLEEKESQVRHMDRIYRHADHVVIHLNAHVRDTE